MRTLLVVLVILLYLILGIPVLIFEYFLGKKYPQIRDRHCRVLVQGVFRVILFCSGTELIVEGREHIPDCAVLFVGNHRSYFDVVSSYTVMRRKTGYIAKKEMKPIPLLNLWMTGIGCLFLDRKDAREGLKTILKAISDLKAGTSLVIYPEGTRNRGADGRMLLDFKEGSLKIAQKAGCPVVPMAILGSAEVYEKHRPWIRGAKVLLRFGEAIDLKELPPEDAKKPARYLREVITGMLAKMHAEHPEIPV